MGKNQHVVRGAGNWKVSSIHRTQAQAIDSARAISRQQHSELVIHGRDGKIRDKDSHSHDPYPAKG